MALYPTLYTIGANIGLSVYIKGSRDINIVFDFLALDRPEICNKRVAALRSLQYGGQLCTTLQY